MLRLLISGSEVRVLVHPPVFSMGYRTATGHKPGSKSEALKAEALIRLCLPDHSYSFYRLLAILWPQAGDGALPTLGFRCPGYGPGLIAGRRGVL
jgi:hypothetical protein